MGLLNDAVNLGLITMTEYEEASEKWGEPDSGDEHGIGYNAGVMGDTSAFQSMYEDLAALGCDDIAEQALEQQTESMYYYAATNNFEIFYDPNMSRWRWERGTPRAGQFTNDPYAPLKF